MLEQKNVHYRAGRPFVNEGPSDRSLLRRDSELPAVGNWVQLSTLWVSKFLATSRNTS